MSPPTGLVDLTGKVALITGNDPLQYINPPGATSGIGRATAVLFNKLNATVILTGRASDRLRALAVELSQTGNGEAFSVAADITKEEDVQNLVDSALIKYKRVDILVNNAGVLEKGTIEDTSLSQFDRVINVNLRAVYHLSHLLVPYLIESKGTIINVSSVNGIRSFAGVLAYNISKAGVDQFTRCAALELAPKGVRVNSVNPGVIVTEMHKRGGMDETTYAAFLDHSKSTHALGRTGEAHEVANAIAFLASDAASFITGASLPVDGGRHAMCPR